MAVLQGCGNPPPASPHLEVLVPSDAPETSNRSGRSSKPRPGAICGHCAAPPTTARNGRVSLHMQRSDSIEKPGRCSQRYRTPGRRLSRTRASVMKATNRRMVGGQAEQAVGGTEQTRTQQHRQCRHAAVSDGRGDTGSPGHQAGAGVVTSRARAEASRVARSVAGGSVCLRSFVKVSCRAQALPLIPEASSGGFVGHPGVDDTPAPPARVEKGVFACSR